MAPLGGGEGGWGNLHGLPQEGALQLSIPLSFSFGRRRRLDLSSRMGDSEGPICQGKSMYIYHIFFFFFLKKFEFRI